MLYVTLFILAAVGFLALALCVAAWPRPKLRPRMVLPQVAQKHVPIICLIRGAESLILAPFAVFGLVIGASFVPEINPFAHPPPNNIYFSVVMLGVILLLVAVPLAKTTHRIRQAERPRFPNFWKVTENSVSTFAFIFAAFAAHDVYQLMPPWKPEPHLPLYMHFLNRDLLWIAVFFLGRSCVITILKRVLELNPKTPPQDSEPPDYSDSGPQAPFDPYNLSNNPPLRPSPGAA